MDSGKVVYSYIALFSIVVMVIGMCVVLSLCWFEPSIMFFIFGMHE